MANGPVPKNQVLWNNIMQRMKARYPSRNAKGIPSQPANREAAKEYKRLGGQYVASKAEIPANMRDKKADAVKKKKAAVAAQKRKNKGFFKE